MANKKDSILKHRKYIYPFILVLLCLTLFSQSNNIRIADDIAEFSVKQSLKEEILEDLTQESPFLPQENKNKIADDLINEFLAEDGTKEEINRQSELIENYYKDENGLSYLYGHDSYYYMRQADNLINRGGHGEFTKEGVEYDDLRRPPKNSRMYNNPMANIAVSLSKIMGSDQAKTGAFWLPVIASIISVLILYFLGLYLFSPDIAVISSLAFIFHKGSYIVFRGGAFDTTAINLLFSIAISYLAIRSFDNFINKKYKNGVAFATGVIVINKMFKEIWNGYFYITAIIIAFVFLYFLLKIIKNNKKYYALGSIPVFLALIYYFSTRNYFSTLMNRLNLAPASSFFPEANKTVVELQSVSIFNYLDLYGTIFLILSIIGLGYLTYQQWKEQDSKLFLIIWSGLIVVPLLSARFYIYGLPALAILFGYGIDQVSELLSKYKFSKHFYSIVIVLIFFISVISPISALFNDTPEMDDAIFKISQDLKETDENTIIYTWWDYGYIYQYYAKRATVFDGGSYFPEKLYWVSRIFMSKNENEATGIIRMISCGGEKEVLAISDSKLNAIEEVDKLIVMNDSEAEEYYEDRNLTEFMKFTHCDAQPAVLLISNDMLNKLNAIDYFANWNFQYGISVSTQPFFVRRSCIGTNCGELSVNVETGEIKGFTPTKLIYIDENFNKTVYTYENGNSVAIYSDNAVYIMEPGLENTILIKGFLLNDFKNFELYSSVNLRKTILVYNVSLI